MVSQHALQVDYQHALQQVSRGALLRGGACSGGCLLQVGCLLKGGVWRPPMTATAAGGTHPTGMHSCSDFYWHDWELFVQFLSERCSIKCKIQM